MLKKLKRWFRLTFASFFYGMKGADDAIINPATASDSEEVNQKQELKGNVFSEMLLPALLRKRLSKSPGLHYMKLRVMPLKSSRGSRIMKMTLKPSLRKP